MHYAGKLSLFLDVTFQTWFHVAIYGEQKSKERVTDVLILMLIGFCIEGFNNFGPSAESFQVSEVRHLIEDMVVSDRMDGRTFVMLPMWL